MEKLEIEFSSCPALSMLHVKSNHLCKDLSRGRKVSSPSRPSYLSTPGYLFTKVIPPLHVTQAMLYYRTRAKSYPGVNLRNEENVLVPGYLFTCNILLRERREEREKRDERKKKMIATRE